MSSSSSSSSTFFGGGCIGETTEWTISGNVYGSLRRKGLSRSGSNAGFCQRARRKREMKDTVLDGNCRSRGHKYMHYRLTYIILGSIIMEKRKQKNKERERKR